MRFNLALTRFLICLIILNFTNIHTCFASDDLDQGKKYDPTETVEEQPIDIKEMVLPSEVSNLPKTGGSIYYSKGTKERPLIGANFWGEVGKPGLHYIPMDTNLVRAISFAGGTTAFANASKVYVNRLENEELTKYQFDLQSGGSADAMHFKIRPNDVVFIPRNYFIENRAYITSLVSVGVTLLSGILLYYQIQKQ